MEDLQTDTLSDYGNKQNVESANFESRDDGNNSCTVNLLNGCEDIDDTLDLMDHCDNDSLGSDVWKGSDSEDELNDKEDQGTENEKPNKALSDKTQCDEEHKDQDQMGGSEVMESEEVASDKKPEGSEGPTNCLTLDQEQDVDEEELAKQAKVPPDEESPKDKPGSESSVKKQTDQELNKPVDDTSEDNAAKKKMIDEQQTEESSEKCGKVTDKDPLTNDEDTEMDYNEDDDDDFDPALLCPEVSMDVDENPVITNVAPGDGNSSPAPYEPETFVDEVTGAEISFNLSAEEMELRKRLYGPTNPIQCTRIHCTACNIHLGSALSGQSNRFVHPLLKVLICKECYHFYTSGEFEKDEDGSELYCRWCGQGGQVLCCSKCEYVFCKRCIRRNFNRKKMFEIRDSESWDCFRCGLSQMLSHRIACYELFDYVRREMARLRDTGAEGGVVIAAGDSWTKDYTRCCTTASLKRPSSGDEAKVKKPKRRGIDVDPDYTPMKDVEEEKVQQVKLVSKQFYSRLQKDNDIEFVRTIPAPQVSLTTVRANSVLPTFRAILPTTARPGVQPSTILRLNNTQPLTATMIPSGGRLITTTTTTNPPVQRSVIMKHEWFEKTVRAAARVNSHLSYTLTQLNRAQSQAASIEELAVVHNKLQEILSNSINSLIQIRKNLRTEFIAGIKTVRLPSKKAAEDDDVIFVSAPTTTMPMPALTPCVSKATEPIVIIDNSNGPPPPLVVAAATTSSTAAMVVVEKPRLKVKSMVELQNVPSECITIPDDGPKVHVEQEKEEERKEEEVVEKKREEEVVETDKTEVVCNGVQEEVGGQASSEKGKTVMKRTGVSEVVYNVKEEPSGEIKRMLSVTVKLTKVNLEDLQKRLPNGCH